MASKKKPTQKKVSAKKQASESTADALADAALRLAREEGWPAVTLARLSQDLAIPLGQVIQTFSTVGQIRSFIFSRIDKTMLDHVRSVDDTETVRDRLFDVLMTRFDALQADRRGMVALMKDLKRNPTMALCRAPAAMHSMALALISAGVSTDGPIGVVRVKVLTAAYATVLRVWLKDDSEDLSQTMSALDKALTRLEQLATMKLFSGNSRADASED